MAWDFSKRVMMKGFIRTYGKLFGNLAKRLTAANNMGDERIAAHMD